MTNLVVLPVWKKDATPADFFEDMANIARVHPDRFTKMVVAYCEIGTSAGADIFDIYPHGVNTAEAIGLLELAKNQLCGRTQTRGNP